MLSVKVIILALSLNLNIAAAASVKSLPTKISILKQTPLPSGTGWIELANTKLRSACYTDDAYGCKNIVAAWNGAIADTVNNIMYIWGGGHNDYHGNEVYALNLNSTPNIKRISERSATWPSGSTNYNRYPDGSITSRHTYGGMTYINHLNKMFMFGGSRYPIGYLTNDIWFFDFVTNKWVEKVPYETSTIYSEAGAIADYDPNTKLVFLLDPYWLYSYNPDLNKYTKISGQNYDRSYHSNGAIDTTNKVFYTFGDDVGTKIDISGADTAYSQKLIKATNCPFKNAGYPGVTFNSKLGKITAWSGGKTIYFYDPISDSCTSQTFATGPGAQQPNGTHGRFRYFPKLDVYVLLNDVDQNAYILRLP